MEQAAPQNAYGHLTVPMILLGLSRAGKTSVGKQLTNLFRCPFYDTDELIQIHRGMSPRDLYRQAGQAELHRAETAALQECITAVQANPAVIAAGGGLCDNQQGAALLSTIPLRIFLYTEQNVLFNRLTQDAEQTGTYPAFLQSLSIVKQAEAAELFSVLYTRRTNAYRCLCTHTLDTKELDCMDMAKTIVQLVHSPNADHPLLANSN